MPLCGWPRRRRGGTLYDPFNLTQGGGWRKLEESAGVINPAGAVRHTDAADPHRTAGSQLQALALKAFGARVQLPTSHDVLALHPPALRQGTRQHINRTRPTDPRSG
ncbi:hypothetical protein GCM10010289_71740 [Streptomyces violascens]|nr:hypothetical protein GCM10010289_71740 [Streptomyces violascens]